MMKYKIFVAVICIFLFFLLVPAQQRYDIVTFTVADGWQREIHPNSLSLLKTDGKGGNGLITIFKPIPVNLGGKINFLIWWELVVRKVVNTSDAPQIESHPYVNGWKVEAGIAQYTSENRKFNLGKGMALLYSFSRNGSVINILALGNTKEIKNEIFDFFDSIVLPPPDLPKVGKPVKNPVEIWERSGSACPFYVDSAKWGKSGHTVSRYEFSSGEYTYTERSFADSLPQIIVIKETGVYDLEADNITIRPQKSLIRYYAKKDGKDILGKLLKTENQVLEIVKYNFTFHHFENEKKFKLVLQADSPTRRDGAYSSDKTYKNAWYFDPFFK